MSFLLLFTYFIIYFWPWPCNAEAAKISSTSLPPPHLSLTPPLAPSLLIPHSLLCCCPALLLTSTCQHLTPFTFSFYPSRSPSVFISLPSSSFFQLPPLLLCASFFPSEFFSLFSLSSAFTSSPLLLHCHLQHRSLHKCPQNLPPKLNSGDTCGGGLCVWCMWVCVCVRACRCLGVVHVSISAHDLSCVPPWISLWEQACVSTVRLCAGE